MYVVNMNSVPSSIYYQQFLKPARATSGTWVREDRSSRSLSFDS